MAGNHQYDHLIAANFERDLRTNFGYTLDLTDIGPLGDRDPMAAFLTDFRRGHCENFAGAMTLMCQSLGIPARFVVGFRCEPADFNSLGDYFVVKTMSGGQSASIVSALSTEIQAMQYPAASANAMVLVVFVAIMVAGMMRVVDVRKELVS